MANPLMSFLLGKWLGHPLHPALVHVPIALWTGAFVFDICSLAGLGGNAMVRTSYWAIALGLLSTLIVVPAGLAEWAQIKKDKPAWKLALWHMLLNVAVTLILVLSLALRNRAYDAPRVELVPFGLVVVAVAGLLVSGYIGGRMVYDQGIAVARMSKQKWRKLAAASDANLPPEK